MSNKYQGLNVLSNNKRSSLGNIDNPNVVNEVAAMINLSGSRSQRRKIEKALNNSAKIAKKANERAKAQADKQLQIRADKDYMYLFAMLGITLYTDYGWDNDSEDSDDITSLYEAILRRTVEYSESGKGTMDAIEELKDLTGIQLISNYKY